MNDGDPSRNTAPTLPDLLRDGLDLVFVGINPSVYSAERGHYFARPGNRFWPGLSCSALSTAARKALAVDVLGPRHDRMLLDHGIGFTDVVKRATPKASHLALSEFATGVARLLAALERTRPAIACFQGVTGYRHVHRMLGGPKDGIGLGLQDLRVGPTRLYLVPSPSGANAHFTLADQIAWYDRLQACLAPLAGPPARP